MLKGKEGQTEERKEGRKELEYKTAKLHCKI